MKRLVLPLIMLIFGAGGGVGAGLFLGGSGAEPSTEDETVDEQLEVVEGEEEPEVEQTVPPRVEPATDETEYVRMNNQFIVPIVRSGSVRSLVVVSLSIEVGTGSSGDVFNREPRLRDSFLRVMFSHANAGGFDGSFTESSALAPLREGLVEAAEGVLGQSTVFDVLITDITRQDA